MSYILDALKKAERERHLTKIPTLETVHPKSWVPRRGPWLWIAAAVLLVNVALLIWLLRPERAPDRPAEAPAARAASASLAERPAPAPLQERPAPAPAPERPAPASPPEKPVVPATAPPEPVPPPRPAVGRPEPEARPQTTPRRPEPTPAPAVAAAPAAPKAEPRRPRGADAPAPPAAAAAPIPEAPLVAAVPDRPAAPPVASTAPKPADRTGPLPTLQDMGADQAAIPKLTLQFLVYSDTPQERLVFINNQKYVEGQSIEGKVVVEGILPDGVILSYQGKRFRLRQ